MSYKAGFEITGQNELSFNDYAFATEAEATIAGIELMSRWFLPVDFHVVEVETELTAVILDGRPVSLQEFVHGRGRGRQGKVNFNEKLD